MCSRSVCVSLRHFHYSREGTLHGYKGASVICPWKKDGECHDLKTHTSVASDCFTATAQCQVLIATYCAGVGATVPGHNVTMPLHHHGCKHFNAGGGKTTGLCAKTHRPW